jgi:hypothetical protein
MTRKHILERPIAVAELKDLNIDDYTSEPNHKADRTKIRQWRRLKQQLA